MHGISRRSRLATALLALLIVGCAHGRPQAPSQPASTRPDDSLTSGATSTRTRGTTASAPATPDPSEQITAEELGTIPDPVPGVTETAPVEPEIPGGSAPSEGTSGSVGGATPGGATDKSTWIWRVQVFASPDRAQAERTARDASSRLGESYVIDREDSLYKVRLGSFTTESAAEPLKRKAVLEGYTGAFRVRTVIK